MNVKVYASGSSGNLYTVSDGMTALIIEGGLPFRSIQETLKFELSRYSACLVSHEHKDHAVGLKGLVEKTALNCYATKGTIEALGIRSRYNLHTLAKNDENDYKWVSFKTISFKPFATVHDANEPVGFLIYSQLTKEKLLYVTDTGSVNYIFPPLHYLLLEINYDLETLKDNYRNGLIGYPVYKKVRKTHLDSTKAVDFLMKQDRSLLKELYVIHRSKLNYNPITIDALTKLLPNNTKIITEAL